MPSKRQPNTKSNLQMNTSQKHKLSEQISSLSTSFNQKELPSKSETSVNKVILSLGKNGTSKWGSTNVKAWSSMTCTTITDPYFTASRSLTWPFPMQTHA